MFLSCCCIKPIVPSLLTGISTVALPYVPLKVTMLGFGIGHKRNCLGQCVEESLHSHSRSLRALINRVRDTQTHDVDGVRRLACLGHRIVSVIPNLIDGIII